MHSLANNHIAIWAINLDNPKLDTDTFRAVLSADEREKANRFRFEKDRRCYTLTRGILRQQVARYTNCEPQNVAFTYNDHGKPFLQGNELSFNVSHSGAMALLAFANNGTIGIDIERVRLDFDFSRILRRYFSDKQASEISNSPDPHIDFFQHWTLKEAFIKAIGSSIFRDLNSFNIPLESPDFHDPETHKLWQVSALDAFPGYAAAIVHNLSPATITINQI